MAAGPVAGCLFKLLVVAENGAADDGIMAPRCGLVVIPEVGSHQIEVGRVAELALVVDDENQLGREADDIHQAAIEQLVQFGQLEAAAVGGAYRLRLGAVRVEQMGLVGGSGF